MNSKLRYSVAASAVALAIGFSAPAYAEGTLVNTPINNEVSVTFSVGGVSRTADPATDSFVVDRKVNLTVQELDNAATIVDPGQNNNDLANDPPFVTFTVTNDSNDTLDFVLSANNRGGSAGAHGGTDNIDVSDFQFFVDANGNNVYDEGIDTDTFIDELAPDTSVAVFVLVDIPTNAVNNDLATVSLTATAHSGGAAGSQGAILTEDTGADGDNTVETVFADGAGTDDAAGDGTFSDIDDFSVAAAAITVAKTSEVLWDPFNGNSNPKAIPGAVVEYCIAVTNAPNTANATNVAISDDLNSTGNITFYSTQSPTGVAPNAAPAVLDPPNGVISATDCAGNGTNPDASALGETGGVVSGNLGDVAPGTTETLLFRVTVN